MYKFIAIAGTFDRLHKGHRHFISGAFKLGERVIIGLTSDRYVDEKFKDTSGGIKIKINNFQIRKKELEDYLKEEGLLGRAEIVKINDVYGPATNLKRAALTRLEALVVTEETYEGGLEVNKKRQKLNLPPLKLLKLPMIMADDDKRIASTRIRLGEIDRWGRAFAKIFNFPASPAGRQFSIFKISDELRNELKKPIGRLIKGDENNLNSIAQTLRNAIAKTNSPLISTVGDEVTKVCNATGIEINLAVVDFKVRRVEKYKSLTELGLPDDEKIMAKNPPGYITNDLVQAIKAAYSGIIHDGEQRIIQVDGEEDLAGVPAILLAPLGSLVIYGQPLTGVVVVEVTEEKKANLLDMITKNLNSA